MVGNCINLFRSDLLTIIMRFVSLPGDGPWIPVPLTVLIASIFWFKRDKIFAVILALAPLAGQIVKYLLKNYYQIPRPAAFGCSVLSTTADRYSFPSGHVIFYTIFFGLLAYWAWQNRKDWWTQVLLAVCALMILLVGYSRVYLGMHWYLDIMGGYIVGGAILLISILVYRYFSVVILNRVKDPGTGILDSSVRPQNDGRRK